jgi:DHA2 family multidrug resistance protein
MSVMLGTIMVTLDGTIANVALPQMQASMSASQEQIFWVLTSYMIALAIATPLSGWLAERFGRKRLMILSVILFTLSSMACGLATSLSQMVLFRLVQGASGASLVPLSQAILLDITPPERQGKAMAWYGIGTIAGPLIGPTLGGWLTDALTWRWVFFINLPIGLLAAAGMWLFLSEARRPDPPRFDKMGFICLSICLASLQLMFDRGQNLDWFSSTEICIEGAVALFFGYVTIVHMFTAEDPFIKPKIFADRNFLFGSIISFLLGVALYSSIPLITTMMQQVLGYPAMLTGIISSPRGVGNIIALLFIGSIVHRIDPRLLSAVGIILAALSLYAFSLFSVETSQSTVLWVSLLQGIGAGLIFLPLTLIVFATLDPKLRNEGTTLFALTRNVGSAVGISIFEAMMVRNSATVHSRLVEGVRPDNPVFAIGAPDLDFSAPASLAGLEQEILRQSTMVAYVDAYWLLFILCLLIVPLCLLMSAPGRKSRAEPLPVME